MGHMSDWRKLPVGLTELCIATTLRCGQSFRWRQSEDETWTCTLRGRVIQLCQDQTHLRYRSIWPAQGKATNTAHGKEPDDTRELLQHYLNLEPNLGNLYEQWSAADANFKKKAPNFTGVRILRQDAWEALVGFICSSNNNIIRISQMVDKLCSHYGMYIATVDGTAYHDFPPASALTGKNVEPHLRELGFGYRAKYISRTAQMIANERQEGWLDSIRNPEKPVFGGEPAEAGPMKPEGREGYRKAHEKLLDLQGVGPKVADCVCLMGLGWGEAVPVDTHVWQIAVRDYRFGRGKHSSLTKATYDAIANHFRKLWGEEAGWAHSVLFTADLRVFSERLSAKTEIKEEPNGAGAEVVQKIVTQTSVKREVDESEIGSKIVVDETQMTGSERVKRRRRG